MACKGLKNAWWHAWSLFRGQGSALKALQTAHKLIEVVGAVALAKTLPHT